MLNNVNPDVYATLKETADILQLSETTFYRYKDEFVKVLDGKKYKSTWHFSRKRVVELKEFAGERGICAEITKEFAAKLSGKPDDINLIDAVINNSAPASTLPELEQEINHYLKQALLNYNEVGKRLIAARAIVESGKWQIWLKNNFNLSYRSAKNYMDVAERFSKLQALADFKYSQLVEMLPLPAGEEEKFIDKMTAAGTPVEKMTQKTVHEKVQKYNDELKKANSQIKELQAEQLKADESHKAEIQKLQTEIDSLNNKNQALNDENKDLTQKLEYNESHPTIETQTVEKIPADYEDLKSKAERLVTVQSKLDSVKAENAELKDNAEKDRARNYKTTRAMAVADSLDYSRSYALGQLCRFFDNNLPAELDDIFKTLKEQISLMRHFLAKD